MVNRIYVLYDADCGLCSRVRVWMMEQPAYCAIEFVAAGSERARKLFPDLDSEVNPEELVVITNEGDVYKDDAAWIVCLWALADYRPWAHRLARGPLRHLARKVWGLISSNRLEISRMLVLQSDADIAQRLDEQPGDVCEVH
jgi:predicted DCC family thiol-disulfide oxidoreductase YuxK